MWSVQQHKFMEIGVNRLLKLRTRCAYSMPLSSTPLRQARQPVIGRAHKNLSTSAWYGLCVGALLGVLREKLQNLWWGFSIQMNISIYVTTGFQWVELRHKKLFSPPTREVKPFAVPFYWWDILKYVWHLGTSRAFAAGCMRVEIPNSFIGYIIFKPRSRPARTSPLFFWDWMVSILVNLLLFTYSFKCAAFL